MKPAPFDYVKVGSVADAVGALAESDGEGKVLAGGQSLMPILSFRLARPGLLVDINGVPELQSIRSENGHLAVGAMVRQRDLETDSQAAEALPLVTQALGYVGHVAIRHRGTVGGSLAHADPAAELPLVAVTLDAEMVIQGNGGTRVVPAAEFFTGPLMTALGADELLTEIRFPRQPSGVGVSIQEIARRSGDFAIVSVAVALTLDGEGTCTSARVGVGGVEAVPRRLAEVESALTGQSLGDGVIGQAADQAASLVDPLEDIHGPADYRRKLTGVLIKRAVSAAANGGQS